MLTGWPDVLPPGASPHPHDRTEVCDAQILSALQEHTNGAGHKILIRGNIILNLP